MILEMVQEIHKMSLEHLRVPEIKEVLKTKTTYNWGMSEGQRCTGANQRSCQWSKLEAFEQQNQSILVYDPKYKINTYESIVM